MRRIIGILLYCMPIIAIADSTQTATVPISKHCLKETEETLQKQNTDTCHHAQYIPFTQVNTASPEIVGYVMITDKPEIDPKWVDLCRKMFPKKTNGWLGALARECRSSITQKVQRTGNLSKDLETIANIVERAEANGVTENHITVTRDSIKVTDYFYEPLLKSSNKSLEPTR